MEEPPLDDPPRRGVSPGGLVVVLLAVIGIGLLVRSPATTPPPTVPPSPLERVSAPDSPPPATADAASEEPTGRPPLQISGRGGPWTTIGRRPPIAGFSSPAAVWTARELVVGFTPDVAAWSPDRRPAEAWRSLPAHPAGALQVRGATQVRGGQIYVYGVKTCTGCPWEPQLWALDPTTEVWERLPDAPGPETPDRAEVAVVGNQLAVVRDRGQDGIQVLAFDPVTAVWRDLEVPRTGPLRWQVVSAGRLLVIAGTTEQPDGTAAPAVLVHDADADAGAGAGAWRDVSAGIPLTDPHSAAAVWTGDSVVLFGASTRGGGARGATLDLATGGWSTLPAVPTDDPVLPPLDSLGPITGLSGVFDGERALFVGGLTTPLFLALDVGRGEWEVRWPTLPRAGATAVWTGRQVLLWGGVDREQPVRELQAWPVRPDEG